MGSNPTPRTIIIPNYSLSKFEEHLRRKVTKKGYSLAESTIKHRVKAIKALKSRVNLWDTDAVQEYIDKTEWTNGRREHVSQARAHTVFTLHWLGFWNA